MFLNNICISSLLCNFTNIKINLIKIINTVYVPCYIYSKTLSTFNQINSEKTNKCFWLAKNLSIFTVHYMKFYWLARQHNVKVALSCYTCTGFTFRTRRPTNICADKNITRLCLAIVWCSYWSTGFVGDLWMRDRLIGTADIGELVSSNWTSESALKFCKCQRKSYCISISATVAFYILYSIYLINY